MSTNDIKSIQENVKTYLGILFDVCNSRSSEAGWWHDPISGKHLLPYPSTEELSMSDCVAYAPYVIGTKIALIHSEVSEALEGYRKDEKDEKLPHRTALECELADVIIRVGDLAKQLKLDVEGAVIEKLQYNLTRPDHQIAARRKPGGKKF